MLSLTSKTSFSIESLQAFTKKMQSRTYAKNTIYLDGKSNFSHIQSSIDVVLSPRYYWVRKAILPVKSASKANKIVKSFFEDILPESLGAYKYKVTKIKSINENLKKNQNEFYLYAYQDHSIKEAISGSGVDMQYINKVFFAQSELMSTIVLDVGDEEVLVTQDGIVIKVSAHIFDQELEMVPVQVFLRNLEKSKEFISIDQHQYAIDDQSSTKIMVLLALFALALFAEYFMFSSHHQVLATTSKTAQQKYDLPASTMQLNSILSSLEKTREDSIKSRQDLHIILTTPLNKGEYIKKVTFNDKTFFVAVSLQNKDNAKKYTDYLSEYFDIDNATVKDEVLSFSGARSQ